MSDESDRTEQLLTKLAKEGRYTLHRPSPYRDWVEKYFDCLYDLVEKQKQPFHRIAKSVTSEIQISPTTLRKHYKSVRKQRRAQAKLAKPDGPPVAKRKNTAQSKDGPKVQIPQPKPMGTAVLISDEK